MSAPPDDLRARLERRVQELRSQGLSDEEILKEGPKLTAELQAAPVTAPETTPESLASRTPGALVDAGKFLVGAANAFGNRAADGATAGVLSPEAAADRAKQKFLETQRLAWSGMASPNLLHSAKQEYETAQAALQDVQDHPVAGFAGSVAGATMGPGSIASRGIAAAGAPGLARSVAAGAVGGGVDATARAVAQGKGAGQALDEGGIGTLLGGTLGGGLHTIGEGLRNPLGETGATIQALQRGEAFLNSPENAALPQGMRGIGAVSYDTGERLGALQAQKLAASRAQIEAAEKALPVNMDEPISVADVHRRLNRSVDRFSNDMAVRPDVEAATAKIKDRLSRVTRQRIEPIMGQDVVAQKITPVIKPKITGYTEEPVMESRVTRQEIEPITERMIVGRNRVPVITDYTKSYKRLEPGKAGEIPPDQDLVGFEDGNNIIAPVHVGYKPGREISEQVQVGTRRGKPITKPAVVGYEPGEEFLGPESVKGYKPGAEVRTAQATPRDLLKERREVRRKAEFGLPETPENAPHREIYDVLKEATHSKDLPNGLGAALEASDTQFAADMKKLAKGNELIFNSGDARAVTDTERATRAAAGKLGQSLMDTRAGGAQLRVLEKIRELGPEYADAVDRVAAKIAEQGSKFGLPRTLASPGKWAFQLPAQNLRWMNVQLTEPFTRSQVAPGAIAGAAAPLLRDPLEALLARNQEKGTR